MNNKILIAINALLVVAVGVLFFLHFSGGNNGKEISMVADSTVSNAKGKAVVYINSDSLNANYEYSKKINADIELKKNTMANTLKTKEAAFRKRFEEYQTKAEYMTAPERAKIEGELGNMQNELENLNMQLQGKLQNELIDMNEKLYVEVESFLKDYAVANGHVYIMQYSRGMSQILYGDPKLDITKDVVNKLNEIYKKKQEEGGAEEPAKEEEKK